MASARARGKFGGLLIVACVGLASLLVATGVFARDREPEVLASTTHILKSKKSGDIPFLLEQTLNQAGQKEVAVYDQIIDGVVTKGDSKVLVGRDLDGDGFCDGWFILGHGGVVKAIDLPSKTADGWDAASRILREHSELFKERNLALIWYEWASRLSAGGKRLRELEQAQINLHSVEIVTDRIAALDKGSEIARINYTRLSEAWTALSERADEAYWSRIRSAVLDEVLTVTGFFVLKWASPILSRFGMEVAESGAGRWLVELQEKYVQGFVRGAKATLLRIKGKMPAVPGSLAARAASLYHPLRITSRNVVAVTQHMVEVMEKHDRLSRSLAHLFKHAIEVGRGGLTKKKYIAGVTGIQASVEVFQRRHVLFDLNPIMLPDRVQNWKDMAMNIGYMTTETFVGSGVANVVRSGYAAMGICAIFSTVDSMLWTRVVKGETDVVRQAIDTGWEVFVGNFQTTIVDPAGFGLGAALAAKTGNQKYQLVGWAVMLVDQAVGYFGYNYATGKLYDRAKKAYDQRKADKAAKELPPVRFVPILAPA